jgi:hypothetical protein
MSQQNFYEAYGAEVHQKTTSDILSQSLAPPWPLISLTPPRFVRASVCWMLPAGPVSWAARDRACRRQRFM